MKPWLVSVTHGLSRREVRVEKYLVLAATGAEAEAAIGAPGAESVVAERADDRCMYRIASYRESRRERAVQ